jgi:hypothetical protein
MLFYDVQEYFKFLAANKTTSEREVLCGVEKDHFDEKPFNE